MDMERKEADKMTIEEARKQKGMSRRENTVELGDWSAELSALH